MSYVLQRCDVCDDVIDPDDPDFKEGRDSSFLCPLCNLVTVKEET